MRTTISHTTLVIAHRLLGLVFIGMLLSACGSGGGSSPVSEPGATPGAGTTCKSLYSVWNSATDLEQFDFTSLYNGATNTDYSYVAYDGPICGYANNPNHYMDATLVPKPANAIGDFDYYLNMYSSLAPAGQCAYYTPPGSSGGQYATALVKVGCNEIEICQSHGAGTCKTFR